MRDHPAMFPDNTVKIIDDMNLGQAMTFKCDWYEAAILQFYATCFFGPDNTLTWMTDDTVLSITYDRFVQILGFSGVGHHMNSMDPRYRPKGIDACVALLKPISELTPENVNIHPMRYPFSGLPTTFSISVCFALSILRREITLGLATTALI